MSTRTLHHRRPTADEVALPDAVEHGAQPLRGHDLPLTEGGRFGLMFPKAAKCEAGPDALEELARLMVAGGAAGTQNNLLPSGYTYLGQFIDHDVTFDPVSQLMRDNDPDALTDFRTPALDLDSLYGSGPNVQPYLYDQRGNEKIRGVRLLVTRDDDGHTLDLTRNDQDRALIGDVRNDENAVIAQLHLLFTRFHNILVDQVRADEGLVGHRLLATVQQRVRRHYQWIVVHDFLPAFAGDAIADLPETLFRWKESHGRPFMPVEFSAAAFRCGHSMVRESYCVHDDKVVPLFAPGDQESLRGRRALDPDHRLDWNLFFAADLDDIPARANRAMRVDERLAPPLARVPPEGHALARLNLLRGHALELPCGQAVADRMKQPHLEDEKLRLGDLPEPARSVLTRSTPLWFYLLREAAERGEGGRHLGPVGGRIVTEVLLGLLDGDPASYVNAKHKWTPDLAVNGTFTMHDLITFVEEHDP